MPEPTKSMLKKQQRQSSKMKLTAKDGARYTIKTNATQNAAQTVIVEYLQATLVPFAQWPGLATVEQDHPYHRLVDAAFCSLQNFMP